VYSVSNGYVADDIRDPKPPKPHQFVHFLSPFISLWWVNIETLNLVHRLIIASRSLWTTNRPWKRHGYVMWYSLYSGGSIHISGMAEARAVKLCTQCDYIKSCQRDDKSHSKEGMVDQLTWHSFACATVDLQKNCHGTPLSEVTSAVDGWWICVAYTDDGRRPLWCYTL